MTDVQKEIHKLNKEHGVVISPAQIQTMINSEILHASGAKSGKDV